MSCCIRGSGDGVVEALRVCKGREGDPLHQVLPASKVRLVSKDLEQPEALPVDLTNPCNQRLALGTKGVHRIPLEAVALPLNQRDWEVLVRRLHAVVIEEDHVARLAASASSL